MTAPPPAPSDERRLRGALIRHVERVQQTVRSCAGCGLCCTAAHNAVSILPFEAQRIARHLRTLPARRAGDLLRRIGQAIRRFRLRRGVATFFTCPFLERDATCALPLDVKPLACLSFNPVEPLDADRCEQDEPRFRRVFPAVESANRAAGLPATSSPIPVAVKDALR
jgi:Fe-S-cluster containining protein